MNNDSAAFILRSADGTKEITIYADGAVSGLEHAPGLTCIVNRIPAIIAQERADAIAEARSEDDEIEFDGKLEDYCGVTPEMLGVR